MLVVLPWVFFWVAVSNDNKFSKLKLSLFFGTAGFELEVSKVEANQTVSYLVFRLILDVSSPVSTSKRLRFAHKHLGI